MDCKLNKFFNKQNGFQTSFICGIAATLFRTDYKKVRNSWLGAKSIRMEFSPNWPPTGMCVAQGNTVRKIRDKTIGRVFFEKAPASVRPFTTTVLQNCFHQLRYMFDNIGGGCSAQHCSKMPEAVSLTHPAASDVRHASSSIESKPELA
ncbi:hypothetical protein TNCV_4357431 [Trichonephila clavipes]|nr:hypothetical protein TNCV_4357431 [Trichonephila clavipes]